MNDSDLTNIYDQDRLHPSTASAAIECRLSIRSKYKIEDLMAELPEGLPMVDGWETMPSVGLEK